MLIRGVRGGYDLFDAGRLALNQEPMTRSQTIVRVRLDADVRRLRDERFDVPATVAAFGSRLYLPNARFDTTPTPETPYTVVAIPRR